MLLINISDIVVTIVHEMHQFTEAQEAAIILQFGELKHATLVRRWFLKEYPDIPHHHVPVACQFSRIRDRFLKRKKNGGHFEHILKKYKRNIEE